MNVGFPKPSYVLCKTKARKLNEIIENCHPSLNETLSWLLFQWMEPYQHFNKNGCIATFAGCVAGPCIIRRAGGIGESIAICLGKWIPLYPFVLFSNERRPFVSCCPSACWCSTSTNIEVYSHLNWLARKPKTGNKTRMDHGTNVTTGRCNQGRANPNIRLHKTIQNVQWESMRYKASKEYVKSSDPLQSAFFSLFLCVQPPGQWGNQTYSRPATGAQEGQPECSDEIDLANSVLHCHPSKQTEQNEINTSNIGLT